MLLQHTGVESGGRQWHTLAQSRGILHWQAAVMLLQHTGVESGGRQWHTAEWVQRAIRQGIQPRGEIFVDDWFPSATIG